MSLPNIDISKLFDVSGKSAIIIGATGSFGRVACSVLGNAGAKLVITAGNGEELEKLRSDLGSAKIEAVAVQGRPDTEDRCEEIVNRAIDAHDGVDILVVDRE